MSPNLPFGDRHFRSFSSPETESGADNFLYIAHVREGTGLKHGSYSLIAKIKSFNAENVGKFLIDRTRWKHTRLLVSLFVLLC